MEDISGNCRLTLFRMNLLGAADAWRDKNGPPLQNLSQIFYDYELQK